MAANLGEEEKETTFTRQYLEDNLNEQQKHFCNEFLFNNRVKSYMAAYPDCEYKSASASATRLLDDARIIKYISLLKENIEEITGVSKIKNITELSKIAYSGIEHLHNTWIELEDWEILKANNPTALAAIESIDTKTETRTYPTDGDEETEVEVKYVKIKLHSKIAAITEINKMMGYNAPEKIESKQVIEYKNVSKQFPDK